MPAAVLRSESMEIDGFRIHAAPTGLYGLFPSFLYKHVGPTCLRHSAHAAQALALRVATAGGPEAKDQPLYSQ
jgi:hypothetical protein